MKKLLLLLLCVSCSLEPEMDLVEVRSLFINNDTCGLTAYEMRLEVDGKEYLVYPEYIPIGLKGNFYAPKGLKEITKAEVYDVEGNLIYVTDNLGEWEVVTLPYEFEDYLVLQFRCK